MSETLQQWLEALPGFEGLLGRGLRLPDQQTLRQSFSDDCPPDALDHVFRCAADTFRVFKMHRFPSSRLRWTYPNALVHCARRADDAIAIWVVRRDTPPTDLEELERQMAAAGDPGPGTG